MKLLMHTCCAPCSIYCIDSLREEGIEPVVYWYNPNIHPYLEYKTRKDTLEQYTKSINVEAIFEDEYGLEEFCKNVVCDLKNRCRNYCYKVRLEKTAQYAKEHGYDTISTTLLVSPYQQHDLIKSMGEEIAKKYGLKFLYRDFRVGFRIGQDKARTLGLYMQKYCGCVFSEKYAFISNEDNKPKLPDGFEFLPLKRSIVIKKEKDNKEKYIDLLFETNPNIELIKDYLKNGDLFVLTYKDDVACVAIVQKLDNETVELKNIVTKNEYRGQGLGKKMIKYLSDNYKQKYKNMIVGTSENNIPFYVKQGFDNYEKTECVNMHYYSKKLK